MKLVTFEQKYGKDLEGKTVDIMFKFPQTVESKWIPTLEIVDIIHGGNQ